MELEGIVSAAEAGEPRELLAQKAPESEEG